MTSDHRGLYRLGGAAWVVAGLLFLMRAILDFVVGPPPFNGADVLGWIAAHRLAQSLQSEVLFFAAVLLVPGIVALYRSLADRHPVRAATGCGVMGVVVALVAVMLVVHGRLVYPIYGIQVTTADLAALVVALFYGGFHAVYLLMAVATLLLSAALWREPHGRPVAYLGGVTAMLDIAAGYPDAIGPVPTLVCQACFAVWFVAMGTRLFSLRTGSTVR